MSLDTLLEAAKFLESSSKGTTKDDSVIARVHHSTPVQTERRRAISECETLERRRRPGGAGTRETHNKLEKNRRAHLKECFDILKREVPSLEDKKTSNLNILRSALKHIQTLKKRERDYEAERDLLKNTNDSIKQRLLLLRKEVIIQQELAKSAHSDTVSSTSSQPPEETNNFVKLAAKLRSVESQALPVSVATQTSFTSGEESDTDCCAASGGKNAEVVGLNNGEENHTVEVKKEVCVDDEDEDVDVEGEITDDNTEDVDGLIKQEGEKDAEMKKPAEANIAPVRSTKRKATDSDDDNKLEAKKSNIQCCARVSC